ncbi:hypothetical protein Y1Q_0002314 [Alligator mississippiensis]|uniref:Uncharacterized protein n=1 Tax=Alligator mississippiensis TaxID=8496 RepID=A0A151MGP9_ALLMI|nr:hypothetical protein Y1Q_0002314 [Alligator mississippiensis]
MPPFPGRGVADRTPPTPLREAEVQRALTPSSRGGTRRIGAWLFSMSPEVDFGWCFLLFRVPVKNRIVPWSKADAKSGTP